MSPRTTLKPSNELTRRILLVEDEPFVAALVSDRLQHLGFDVKTAMDVLSARRLLQTFDPDLALLDINLGAGPSGIDLAHYLAQAHPDIALLILTRHPDYRSAGINAAGALPQGCGFLRKDLLNDLAELTKAIEDVLRDQTAQHRHDQHPDRPLHQLTSRQIEVLRLASLGMSNAAIAHERGISERAVEKLLQSTFNKLEVSDSPGVNRRVEGIRRFIAAAGIPQTKNPPTRV